MKVIDLLKYSASFYKKDCSKKIHELAKVMNLDINKRIYISFYWSAIAAEVRIQRLLHPYLQEYFRLRLCYLL